MHYYLRKIRKILAKRNPMWKTFFLHPILNYGTSNTNWKENPNFFPFSTAAIQVAHGSLRSFDLILLQHVLELIERPWNERHPTLSAILGGEEDLQPEEVLAYVESESPSLLLLFVDFLAKQDCQVSAPRGCTCRLTRFDSY